MREPNEKRDNDESRESSKPKLAGTMSGTGAVGGSIPPPTEEELAIDAGWGGAAEEPPKPTVAKPTVAKPAAAAAKPKAESESGTDIAKQLFEQVFGKKEFKGDASASRTAPKRTSESRVAAKPAARAVTKPAARTEVKPAPKRQERKPPKARQKRAAPDKRAARKERKAAEKAARAAERQAQFEAANRAAQNAAKRAEEKRLERQRRAELDAREQEDARDSDPAPESDRADVGTEERAPRKRKPKLSKAAAKRKAAEAKREPDIPLEKMRPSEEDTSTKAFERLPFKWLVAALLVAGGVVFLAMKM